MLRWAPSHLGRVQAQYPLDFVPDRKQYRAFLLLMMRPWGCGQPAVTDCWRKQPKGIVHTSTGGMPWRNGMPWLGRGMRRVTSSLGLMSDRKDERWAFEVRQAGHLISGKGTP